MKLFRRDYVCPQCGSERVSLHQETLPAVGEVDYWAPVRNEAFRCNECGLQEHCDTDAGATFAEFHRRWNDDLERRDTPEEIEAYRQWAKQVDASVEAHDRAWTWPQEDDEVLDRSWRAGRLRERRAIEQFSYADAKLSIGIDLDPDLEARILAQPDATEPRWALVQWLRANPHPLAAREADFIEGQLKLAESFAEDPRGDARDALPDSGFLREPGRQWWRHPGLESHVNPLFALDRTSGVGLIDDRQYFRGFIEHVAVKAARFLEIADELYSLAPIRQLTITYCKGPQHDDLGLLKALLASPHLDRIRALRFPVRVLGLDNPYTELNRLTDDDMAMFAESEHLRGLRVLDLEDATKLSIEAFHALAASKQLPELSAVYSDIYHYYAPGTFSFGTVGGQIRQRFAQPLRGYAKELEARHGWIPWLHVAEYYGSEMPEIEAVIENPIALAKRA